MYVYYPHWYTRLPLVLYEDDVNLSPEFEGNIVKSHANTFLCRDCSVFITIIINIIILYRRYIYIIYIIIYTTPPQHCSSGSSLRIPKVHVPCSSRCMNNVVTERPWRKNTVSHLCNSNNMYTHNITSERLVLYRHSSWI